jgi:hypothetical protein
VVGYSGVDPLEIRVDEDLVRLADAEATDLVLAVA